MQHNLEQSSYRVIFRNNIIARCSEDTITWHSDDCQNGGIITKWQGTDWDQTEMATKMND